ncbi:cobalamin biosynthesis protein CobQ [Yoonia sp. R2331]|uniref:cobalamin biosynthesis protein CobQ n=1 Tax=Yoonia sp. R2331 TaxID=3237238 RepID=UPI0034E53EEC
MMSQTHLIFGMAAFGKPENSRITLAALAGSFIPDASLYLLAGAHLFVLNTPPQVVFGQLYYSESWQAIFRIDNSIVLWAITLMLGIMFRAKVVIALCGAALLHLFLDFPLHNDDARAHFWPITDWKFISLVSYWDSRYYGHIVGPVEVAASLVACVWLFVRFRKRWERGVIAVLTALQLAAAGAYVMGAIT